MVHGDDDGLVLPPHVAPVECRIIPIAQHKEGVLDRSYALLDELKKAGYRVKIDDSDKSTGWKFSEQEILGIPTRIEIGPKDIEKNQVVVVRRDNREKIVVSLDEIAVKLREILEQEQHFALQVLQLTESRLLTTLCISREDMSVSRRRSVESAESLNVCLQSVRFRSSS